LIWDEKATGRTITWSTNRTAFEGTFGRSERLTPSHWRRARPRRIRRRLHAPPTAPAALNRIARAWRSAKSLRHRQPLGSIRRADHGHHHFLGRPLKARTGRSSPRHPDRPRRFPGNSGGRCSTDAAFDWHEHRVYIALQGASACIGCCHSGRYGAALRPSSAQGMAAYSSLRWKLNSSLTRDARLD